MVWKVPFLMLALQAILMKAYQSLPDFNNTKEYLCFILHRCLIAEKFKGSRQTENRLSKISTNPSAEFILSGIIYK